MVINKQSPQSNSTPQEPSAESLEDRLSPAKLPTVQKQARSTPPPPPPPLRPLAAAPLSSPPIASKRPAHSRPTALTPQLSPLRWQRRATVLALSLGLLPVLAIGGIGYVAGSRMIAQSIATEQKEQALQTATTLNQFMAERLLDIETIAHLPILRNPKLRSVASLPEKQQILEQLRETYRVYENITVFDLNGNIILKTSGTSIDNRNRQAIQTLLKTQRATIHTAQPKDSLDTTSIYLATPVEDGATGNIIAIVTARLSADKLASLLPKRNSSDQTYTFVDGSGTIVFSSESTFVNRSLQDVSANLSSLHTAGKVALFVTPPLLSGVSLFWSSDDAGPVKPDSVVGFAPTLTVRGMPSLNWSTLVSLNPQLVVNAQKTLLWSIAGGTVGFAAFVAAIAALTAHRATRSVEGTVEDLNAELQQAHQKLDVSETQRNQSIERSRLLSNIVEKMRQSLRQDDILSATVNELRYSLGTNRVIVYRFEDDWTGTIIAESVGTGWKKTLGETVNDPFREGLIDRYRNGRVRTMNDIYAEGLTKCHREILEGFEIKASIVAPILQNGHLTGLLCAHECAGPRNWTAEDVELFAQLASQLGYVLDQSTLLQKQTRSAERSRLLNEIVNTMRRSLKEDDILNTTVSELRYALNTDRVIVYYFESDWCGTIVAESVGLGWLKTLGEKVNDPFREGLIERYRNGRVRVMHDIYAEGLTNCHREILEGFQIKASIVAPILQHGALIGLLCAHQCSGPRQWQEEDVDLFGKLATQLGFALDQATLIRKQIRTAERSRLLSEIVGNMRRSMTQESVLNTTVSELRYALNTDRVIVYRFHDECNGTVIAESVAAGWRKTLGEKVHDPFKEGLLERYRNGRVRTMDDVRAEEITPCHQEILDDFQIRASIVAPILQAGELVGLLCAHQCSGARKWEPEEVDLLTQLAIQLGFALDQASLLEYTEQARKEARAEADAIAEDQRQQKEFLQKRAMELLVEVEPVSKGNLTVRAKVTPDEVGTIADSYNTIIQSLREIVEQAQSASQSVAENASINEAAVGKLSQEAKHQLQGVHEALDQIQAMVNSIQGVAKRAQRAEMRVQLASQALQEGDEAMDRTVSGISTIRETVAETAKKVKRLGEASQKISRVVSLINGFAAQTNLLALNASIEAAKAGEEGQGFAVVAEEVRTLAQQSTSATAEIEQLVIEIQTQTSEVVAAMEAGTEQVVMGTQLVEESREKLSQINDVSHQINELVQEISQEAAAQTQTSITLSQRMQQVANIADDTSKQSENVAQAFAQLSAVADELQVSISRFKVK